MSNHAALVYLYFRRIPTYTLLITVDSRYSRYTECKLIANLLRWARLELWSSKDKIDVVDDFAVKQHWPVCLVTLAK